MVYYIPSRLKKATEQICVQHPLERDVLSIEENDELKNFIFEIVSLKMDQIKAYVLTLSDNELLMVAGYIPHNYFNVKLDNLFEIVKFCINNKICLILYKEWQGAYDNKLCNEFLCDLLDDKKEFLNLILDLNYDENHFRKIVVSDNIPYHIGKLCLSRNERNISSLAERARYYGIEEGSALYHEIERIYYTYCTRNEYLGADINKMLLTISKYKEKTLRDFLYNFLSCLSLNDLDKFIGIGNYLDRNLGDVESKRCKDFFQDNLSGVWEKYHNWIIRIKINDVFGNDERSIFWRQYKFVSKPIKYNQSNSVSMEFKDYIVVEFLGQAMGPIYFYKKDVFNNVVKKYIVRESNSELRQTLFHSKIYEDRQVHTMGWTRIINHKLISNMITEKLELD